MKRILTNLKAYASAAMAVAVMGVAALGVSCKYDDTAIYDEISGVKGDLAALEERVVKLEQKLNTEITGLQALIVTAKQEVLDEVDGKFATVNGSIEDLNEKYAALAAENKELAEQLIALESAVGQVITAKQNVNGEWVLTLSDGKEITIYPKSKTEYHGVTVIEQNGVMYWAKYNADGTIVPILDKENNKYPVHHATPAVDVDGAVGEAVGEAMSNIQVSTNDEGMLQLTLDGGKTWYPLGGGADAGLFTGVEQDVEAGTATFSLVGGETITVELAKEAEPEMVFGIKGGKVYFDNEETKKIAISSQLVKDVVVLQQPKGWEVEYDGKDLFITAPSYLAVVDEMTADEEGLIKALATDGTGAAIVSKLIVSTSENGVFLTVHADKGTFDIYNTMVYEEYGESYPTPYYYSVMKASDFDVEAMKAGIENYEMPPCQQDMSNYTDLSIAEVYGQLNYSYDEDWNMVIPEMVPGETYVVWVAPHSMVTYQIDLDAISYVEYKHSQVSCELVSASFADLVVDVKVKGYDGYYLKYYTDADNIYAQEDFLGWTSGMSWWPWAELFEDEGFNGSLFDALSNSSMPGTKYHVYLLPYDAEKNATDYTWDEVRHYEFSTTGFSAGGEGAPTFVVDTEKTAFTNIVGTLTPVADSKFTYYRFYTAEELAAFADDAALIANLLNLSLDKTYIIEEEESIRCNNLKPGDARTLVAISVDAEGKYGQLVKVEASTKAVAVGAVSVNIDDTETSTDGLQFSVKLSATGGDVVKYRYELVDKNSTRWTTNYKTVDNAHGVMAIVTDNDYYVKTVAAADLLNEFGWATFNAGSFDKTYVLLVAAIDADGNMGAVASHEFTSTFAGTVIKKYQEDGTTINPTWEASKPTVEMTVKPGSWSSDVEVTVTPGKGATMCWMGKFYIHSEQLATAKVKNVLSNWANGGRKTLTDRGVYGVGHFTTASDTMEYTMSDGYHIHILWQDADGNYYEPYCVEWAEDLCE